MRQPGKDSLRMLVNDTVDDSSRRNDLQDERADGSTSSVSTKDTIFVIIM
jgi:hypothetical protein